MSERRADLSQVLDHPGAYLTYDDELKLIYLNVMPQVRVVWQERMDGIPVVAQLDRDDRIVGVSVSWNPLTGR